MNCVLCSVELMGGLTLCLLPLASRFFRLNQELWPSLMRNGGNVASAASHLPCGPIVSPPTTLRVYIMYAQNANKKTKPKTNTPIPSPTQTKNKRRSLFSLCITYYLLSNNSTNTTNLSRSYPTNPSFLSLPPLPLLHYDYPSIHRQTDNATKTAKCIETKVHYYCSILLQFFCNNDRLSDRREGGLVGKEADTDGAIPHLQPTP